MTEYTREELEKMVTSDNPKDRWNAARNGVGLDVLIDDPDYLVRCAVAWRGYGLEKLVDDDDPEVRAAVAFKGYGINKLKHDKSELVRNVAEAYLRLYGVAGAWRNTHAKNWKKW